MKIPLLPIFVFKEKTLKRILEVVKLEAQKSNSKLISTLLQQNARYILRLKELKKKGKLYNGFSRNTNQAKKS